MADGANQLQVRLVTPDRLLFDQPATAVELPAKNGYVEALYGHAPLLAELGAGEVRIHTGDPGSPARDRIYVAWGFVEVLPERVTILAEIAMRPEEINQGEAEANLQHGQELWQQAGDDELRYEEANETIHEAEARLASARRPR